MRRCSLSCVLLFLLAQDSAWACRPDGAKRHHETIAINACDLSEWQFRSERSDVRAVYVDEGVLRVYLGNRLLGEILRDEQKRSRWLDNLRFADDIQWKGEIDICDMGDDEGSRVWIRETSERQETVFSAGDDPVSCSIFRR